MPTEKSDGKAPKASISFPDQAFLDAIDSAADARKLTRSGWVQDWCAKGLTAEGRFPGDPANALAAEIAELVKVHGAPVVRAKLGELALAAAGAEGES